MGKYNSHPTTSKAAPCLQFRSIFQSSKASVTIFICLDNSSFLMDALHMRLTTFVRLPCGSKSMSYWSTKIELSPRTSPTSPRMVAIVSRHLIDFLFTPGSRTFLRRKVTAAFTLFHLCKKKVERLDMYKLICRRNNYTFSQVRDRQMAVTTSDPTARTVHMRETMALSW